MRFDFLKSNKNKKPLCTAFVDFEHWYIGLERQYGVKPDIKAWKEQLEKEYEALGKLLEGEWKKTKKKIRKRIIWNRDK